MSCDNCQPKDTRRRSRYDTLILPLKPPTAYYRYGTKYIMVSRPIPHLLHTTMTKIWRRDVWSDLYDVLCECGSTWSRKRWKSIVYALCGRSVLHLFSFLWMWSEGWNRRTRPIVWVQLFPSSTIFYPLGHIFRLAIPDLLDLVSRLTGIVHLTQD